MRNILLRKKENTFSPVWKNPGNTLTNVHKHLAWEIYVSQKQDDIDYE
jgi:hypothetical protein